MRKILRFHSQSANERTENNPPRSKASSNPFLHQLAHQHPNNIYQKDCQNQEYGNSTKDTSKASFSPALVESDPNSLLIRSYDEILDSEAIQLFLQREPQYLPDRMLFSNQKYVKPVHRSQAMIYFSELHDQYQLKMATLLFAGNILDRFLAAHCIDGAMELYKAINCSIYLAMKIEEIYPPTMDELTRKSDKSFLVSMAKYQQLILTKIDYKLQKLSPFNFLNTLQSTRKLNLEEKHVCYYLLELYMLDNHLMGAFPFSLIALAIDHFIYILRTGSSNGWTNALGVHSLIDIDRVAAYLFKIASQAKKQTRQIYDKYSKPKYMSVSMNSCFIQAKIQ